MGRLNLKPLQQWVCDQCGEIIEEPEHGYVEFKMDGPYHDFRIVHHTSHSPTGNCYYPRGEFVGSFALSDFVGAHGLVKLTCSIDPGEKSNSDASETSVKNMHEWVLLLRRLQVPHFEEARFYFARARADSGLGGSNDVPFYSPDGLKEILREYGDDE